MRLSDIMSKYRKDNNLSTRAFAEKIGCTNAYVSLLENDKIKSPTLDIIMKIANAMDLELDTFLDMMDNMNVSLKKSDESIYRSIGLNFFNIPLYQPLCCGNGKFVEDNIIEYIPVPSKGLSKANDYFCQYAVGDSMKEAGIQEGDILVFEKSQRIPSGSIGCFCIDENLATCKKYSEQAGFIVLQPMNNEYEPIVIDPMCSSFRCIGKLKKVIKDID